MDVYFQQGLSRNGLDESYFAFLGLGKKKRERASDANEESQLQDLENRFPDMSSIDGQANNIVLLNQERDKLSQERSKAKSKKTKSSLDARIRAYDRYISDYNFTLEKMKLMVEEERLTPPTPQREIIVSPAPIITSKDGEIELPKKQVFMEETSKEAIENKVSPLLAKEDGILPVTRGSFLTQSPSKKDNTLLIVGIGVAILVGVLLIRKNN
jgi:hypothetical protein